MHGVHRDAQTAQAVCQLVRMKNLRQLLLAISAAQILFRLQIVEVDARIVVRDRTHVGDASLACALLLALARFVFAVKATILRLRE